MIEYGEKKSFFKRERELNEIPKVVRECSFPHACEGS